MRLYFTVILFLIITIIKGQSIEEIETEIKLNINNNISNLFVSVIKPSITNIENKIYDDPDSLLERSYIFFASGIQLESDIRKGAIGIYKNNQIKWFSNFIINMQICTDTDILAIKDINNDGQLEIITSWKQSISQYSEEIWIFSWDGYTSNILNDYNELGESDIHYVSHTIKFMDMDPDGILEIYGNKLCENEEIQIYKWNGIKYENYSGIVPDIIPRDKLYIELQSFYHKGKMDTLNYIITNLVNSPLEIDRFSICKKYTDSNFKIKNPDNWLNYTLPEYDALFWVVDELSDNFREFLIKPTVDSKKFELCGNFLPCIGKIYVTGFNGKVIDDEDEIFINSKEIYNIIPKNNTDNIEIAKILKSISSYNNHSHELGWIKDENIKNKYSNYLATVDSLLTNNRNNQASEQLSKLINDIEIDSLEYLTNESYALLKYNTEYLLEQIPEDKPQDIRSLIEQLKVYNDECKSKDWYTADWAHNVQKIAIDNGIMMLNLNVPASTLIIMEQFNITMDYYKNAGFLTQDGFDLLRPQNDLLIAELKKVTSGEQ